MPKCRRKKSRSGVYHVYVRGVNQQIIFEEMRDRNKFLSIIEKYKDMFDYKLYGYCLMDNHAHLLIKETENTSISEIMKRICLSYVCWHNAKYDRSGHLFQGRFGSETVEHSLSLMRVLRYIHQNPLKAGLVKDVLESEWTSIHEYVHDQVLVDRDEVLGLFSTERNEAIRLFVDFMKQTDDDLYENHFEKIRMSDDEVVEHLNQMGITSIYKLQKMDKTERDAILADLKKMNGVSIRQLARITGISKSVIQRAGW